MSTLETAVRELITQWRVVTRAPLSFLLCVIVGAAATGAAMNWGYQRQMDSLKERIATLQEQVKTADAKAAAKEAQQALTEKELNLYKTLPTKTTSELKQQLQTIISQIVAHGGSPALVSIQVETFEELKTAEEAVRQELTARRSLECAK